MKTLLVKNMVCHRCILAVKDILDTSGISYSKIDFGEIHLHEALAEDQLEQLTGKLSAIGFELIGNRMSGLIERIKKYTILKARNDVLEKEKRMNLSSYLSEKLHHEYTYLSSIFSSVEGRTIEKFFIDQRIEKVKEMLVYNELSLSEIAYALDYSSTAHLSSQFKKVTGLTPSHFKEVGQSRRRPLDNV